MFEMAFPPAFILMLGALLIALARPGMRPVIVLLTPIVTAYAIWQLPDGVLMTAPFLGYQIELVEANDLRRLFGTMFAMMARVKPCKARFSRSSLGRVTTISLASVS